MIEPVNKLHRGARARLRDKQDHIAYFAGATQIQCARGVSNDFGTINFRGGDAVELIPRGITLARYALAIDQ